MHFLTQAAYAILSMPCLVVTLGAPLTRRCWAKDASGRYCWVNDNFAADLGCGVEEMVGRSTTEVWPQCWREIVRVDRIVMEQRSDVVAHSEELEFPTGTLLVAVTRVPLVDDKGVVIGVSGYYDAPAGGEMALRHERQLMLHELTAEQHERVAEGMRAFAEELTA